MNTSNKIQASSTERRRVGLVYDEQMCKHYDSSDENHEEGPGRILSVWNKLTSTGLTKRCLVFGAKEVDEKFIYAVHTRDHADLITTISSNNERNDKARDYSSLLKKRGNNGTIEGIGFSNTLLLLSILEELCGLGKNLLYNIVKVCARCGGTS